MTKDTKPAFLRQCWYVFGLSDELGEKGWLSRRIIGEQILMMRCDDGALKAIADRCPHRFVPLSMGHIANGTVKCSYHGLTFNGEGDCTHNPHGPVSNSLAVKAYPAAQLGPLLWVWMGDPAGAEHTPPPQYKCTIDGNYMTSGGYIHGSANYQLMSDNILDLSHIEFLHPRLGTEAVSRAGVKVEAVGDHVVTTRQMTQELLPEGLANVYQTGGALVNRELRVEWQAPCLMELLITVTPLEGEDRSDRGAYTLHLFAPETENSTHYFYVAGMDSRRFSEQTITAFRSALDQVFNLEDKPMIDAQQAMIGFEHDIMDLRPAMFGIDKAPIMARRKLQQLIEAESRAESEVA